MPPIAGRRHRGLFLAGLLVAGVALAALKAWPALFPDPLARGEAAYARGDYAAATTRARERLRTAPDDPEALRLLARASARLGRRESAARLYARLDPARMTAEDRALHGLVLSASGRGDAALREWEEGLRAAPENAEILEPLAHAYARQGRFDRSAALAERLARLPRREALGAFILGVARHELNDPAGAAEALGRALRVDPGAAAAGGAPDGFRKLLARDLLRLGRHAEAREPLRALERSAPDPELAWLLNRQALQAGDRAGAARTQAGARSYRTTHPLAPEPSPYVGEVRCAGCHKEIAGEARASRHARSYHHGDGLETLDLPGRTLADPGDPAVTHAITRAGDRVRAETTIDGKVARSLVEYAFGTPDHYVTMVGRDERGAYHALRMSHHRGAGGSGWDLSSGDVLHPETREGFLGRPVDVRDGSIKCLACHVTNVRGGASRTGPETADRGIGCEKCHGPGANHLAAVAAGLPDLAIVNPAHAPAGELTRSCAECHTVGDVEAGRSRPRTDPIWARSHGVTLTWSRCFTESGGALSCVTCHDPHRDAERSAAFYESKCLGCHAAPGEGPHIILGSEAMKRVPCPKSPARGCLDCHMPRVPDAIRHTTLADHYIRVHDDASENDRPAPPQDPAP